ncbi:MAG: hypothetical protein HXS44_00830 [Theionarchaea archaeon]|nr:hypothetical protein [Theionarchaea archaeon]
MPSGTDELVTSSSFGNSYVTPLGIEIRDFICRNQKGSREVIVDTLCQRGYTLGDITEELDRQCYCSTMRFVPSDSMFFACPVGVHSWGDICSRIYDQESMIAGKIHWRGSRIAIDVYRSDFQFSKLRKEVKSQGLHTAPVMRWTGRYQKEGALQCLDRLTGVMPFISHRSKGDLQSVIEIVTDVVSRKSRRVKWAWLITHPVTQLILTPSRKAVMKKLFLLSNGPVEWKGTLVSLCELTMHTHLSREEVKDAVLYLEGEGIIREVNKDLTPTGLGYTLLRSAFKSTPLITFAIIRRGEREYQLEISSPSSLNPEIRDTCREHKGSALSEYKTPTIFPLCRKSHILDVMDRIIRVWTDTSDIGIDFKKK